MAAPLPSSGFAHGGRYVPDHESFGAMMVSEQLRKTLVRITKRIKTQAKANTQASSGGSKELANGYRDEVGPLVTLIVDGKPSPRISQRVVNGVRYAAAHEFGRGGRRTNFRNGSRDLRRAGQMYGDLRGEVG